MGGAGDRPLQFLVEACSIVTGGMGSGKSLFATLMIEALIRRMPELGTLSFGVIDAKGNFSIVRSISSGSGFEALHGEAREALLSRIVVIDFSAREALSSYNVLAASLMRRKISLSRAGWRLSRNSCLQGERLSLRGTSVLKPALALLAEFGLPITYVGELLVERSFPQKACRRDPES